MSNMVEPEAFAQRRNIDGCALSESEKQLWLKELRSGWYYQIRGELFQEYPKFCAVGLLYHILPTYTKHNKTLEAAAFMNDHGISFRKIADWLESPAL